MQIKAENNKESAFLLSGEGIAKVVAIVLVLTSCILFLSISTCQENISWNPNTFPITTAVCSITLLIFYIILSTKIIEKHYRILYLVDVIVTLAMCIVLLVISGLKISNCRDQSVLSVLPGAFAIMGSLALCAYVAIAVAKLIRRTEINNLQEVNDNVNVYRKSIVV